MPQSSTTAFSGIFVSYRRDDSSGHAGRLFDKLIDHFGKDRIFMDIDTIEPGEDFVTVIEGAVGSCEILLAIIGRDWLSKPGETTRRLDNPNDFVRVEIATALNRNIRVIPVLVQRAGMPRSEDLPDDLKKFTRRNAIELTDLRWQTDVDQLITAMERVLAKREEAARLAEAAKQAEAKRQREEEAERQLRRQEEEARQRLEEEQRREQEERREEEEKKNRAEEAARLRATEEQRVLAEKERGEAEEQARQEAAQAAAGQAEEERRQLEIKERRRRKAKELRLAEEETKQRIAEDLRRREEERRSSEAAVRLKPEATEARRAQEERQRLLAEEETRRAEGLRRQEEERKRREAGERSNKEAASRPQAEAEPIQTNLPAESQEPVPLSKGKSESIMLLVDIACLAVVAGGGLVWLGRINLTWATRQYILSPFIGIFIFALIATVWKANVPPTNQRPRLFVIGTSLTVLVVYALHWRRVYWTSHFREVIFICIGCLLLAVISFIRNSTIPPSPRLTMAGFLVGCYVGLLGYVLSWWLVGSIGWTGHQSLRAASAVLLTLSVIGFGRKANAATSARLTAALAVTACVTILLVME